MLGNSLQKVISDSIVDFQCSISTANLRGGSRISEGGANIMVGWLRSDKLIQLAIVLSMQSMHVYLGGFGGMPPTEKFCKFSLFSIKIWRYF